MRSRATVQAPAGYLRGRGFRYNIHPAETAAGFVASDLQFGWDPGHALRYKAACDGVEDDYAKLQKALDAGFSLMLPEGAICGVTGTLETTTANQLIVGLGNGAKIIKHANVPLYHVLHYGAGFRGVIFEGAYDGGFGALNRPVGAPAVVDTTDCVQVGTDATGTPYFWLAEGECNHAGRDGFHHLDGPAGAIGVLTCAYNSRWGYNSEQSAAFDGGSAIDTAHVKAQYLHCHHNGRGPHTQTEGGNIHLRGHANVINAKSFGAWGEGIRVNGAVNDIRYFSELDAGVNIEIADFATGQNVTAGTYRRSATGVYVATTSGLTGVTAPVHTAGTASDGAVTWRFRGNRSVITVTGARNKNKLFALFENGLREISEADLYIGTGTDGNVTHPLMNMAAAAKLRATHQAFFGAAGGSGAYSYLELAATPGASGEYDLAHASAGALATLYLGRNGSTDFPLRLRGSDYGHIADMVVGGRVVNVGDTDYTLFDKDVSVGDIFVITPTANREFNIHLGGANILPGRRITVVSEAAFTIHIYGTGQSTTRGSFGAGDFGHDLTAAGDWMTFEYLGGNYWRAFGRKAGALVC